jgi:3-oxoacyl-[acyl-carrier protein] reductase
MSAAISRLELNVEVRREKVDLGISGRKAIVCASSKGLGRACAAALAEAGCELVLNGRDPQTLAATASDIRGRFGVTVHEAPGDLNDPATRAVLLAAAPQADILVNNNGGPPFKAFAAITRADILAGVESNMLTPIALVQALLPGMVERRFGRIVNITSGSVRAPIAGLDVSSGARAGLTAFLAAAARANARENVTINFILPGAFATDRQRSAIERGAAQRGVPFETARAEAEARSPAGRFGDPAEFGALCAFLASAHAGFITGQNFLIDGGAFPGAF